MSDPNGKSATNAHHPEAILSKIRTVFGVEASSRSTHFCGVVERRSKGYPMPLEAAFGPVRGARAATWARYNPPASHTRTPTLARASALTWRSWREVFRPSWPMTSSIAFVSISETLITSILRGIPRDPRVVSAVRNTVRDHCIDEARHHSYFVYVVHQHWASSTPDRREILGPLYAKLIRLFLA